MGRRAGPGAQQEPGGAARGVRSGSRVEVDPSSREAAGLAVPDALLGTGPVAGGHGGVSEGSGPGVHTTFLDRQEISDDAEGDPEESRYRPACGAPPLRPT